MESLWWLLPFALALVVGALCPMAGTLLLVQRRLFLANLVSHAVLPGLALAQASGGAAPGQAPLTVQADSSGAIIPMKPLASEDAAQSGGGRGDQRRGRCPAGGALQPG